MMSLKYWSIVVLALLLISPSQQFRGFSNCNGGDCIVYQIVEQADCTEVTAPPTNDRSWHANLSPRTDELILGGKIVAYQIQWFSGSWSGWFVPGQNDMDNKYNTIDYHTNVPTKADSLRRSWSYFQDHTHKYIICKY